MERRREERRAADFAVSTATISEARMPAATAVDASEYGLLVRFDEPVFVAPSASMCISVPLPDGALHLSARVARVARGEDFRGYVALALDRQLPPVDLDRWRARIGVACPVPASHAAPVDTSSP